MFKFDFDIDDAEENLEPSLEPSQTQDKAATQAIAEINASFSELSLEYLLEKLPSQISCSPVSSDGSEISIARRDIFDARFQLIAENELTENVETDGPSPLELIEAPSDLIPGVYEGGMRVWEASLDLVEYLNGRNDIQYQGKRLIELGCGTAIPSLSLLSKILSGPSHGQAETHLHLQDYNKSVLELITFPNVLLAWYMSPASSKFRESHTDDENPLPPADPSSPAEITITPELKQAFLASLKAHNISLRFFSGAWSTLQPHLQGPYDILLTSETIYRNDSLPSLLDLMQAACSETDSLCLVAAKVLYFGVGGGVSDFIHTVEKDGRGAVEVVWERNVGVGRRIMSVRWRS